MELDTQTSESSAGRKGSRIKKPLFLWLSLTFIALVMAAVGVFVANVPLSSPVLRERIVAALAERLDSDVDIGELRLRVYPALRAEGNDLRIRRRGADPNLPPLIAINSFHVDGSLFGIWRKHVDHVKLTGLEISIPPKSERVREQEIRESAPEPTATSGSPEPGATDATEKGEERRDPLVDDGVVIDRVDTDDARLVIVPEKDGAKPKVWAIHHLTMHNLNAPRSWPFEATLTNAVPPGEIDVSGGFGPWNRDEPSDTPLHGRFTFAMADLSVFKGISGMLSSKGSFFGTLDQIHANGETETPDFTIAVGGHPFALHTKYRALIDGTNGDTQLERIDADFLNSHVLAKGAVLDGPKGEHGRTVVLDVNMDQARIDDVMTMAVRTSKPPMTGGLKLSTKFVLPPGETDVAQRLRLDGRFSIAKARFNNYDVQGKINELSKRTRGVADDSKHENVVSDFGGRFRLGDGRLSLPDLTFAIPGAKVELAGGYALKPETLDFKGQVVTDAYFSEMVTGWKKWLMKPADAIFRKPKKEGKGSIIPIKVGGTRNDPKFGLDVRSVFKRRG
ncbi:MAG TPA: AsmA-like C-terminal region-containing protein [Vicinamibacterales bacterium]|nr:AsmA-like C-terminal region-containing protein [Vicinamibacterales bacterium]